MANHTPKLALVCGLLGCARPPLPADGGTTTSQSSTVAGSESTGGGESSESSGTESTGESTDATTSDFVPPPFDFFDDSPCDPYAQDCPEGEKCVPYGSTGGNWDSHKCVPVLGDQEPGEPCHYDGGIEATDDCDATSLCWDVMDVDGELIGTCAPFCTGTPDDPQCPDFPGCIEYSCLTAGNSTVNICIPTCDPLAQDCSAGLGCYWVNDDFHCIFTTDDFPIGEVCETVNDCVVGSTCAAFELLPDCAGGSCCTPFCDPAALVDSCPGLLPGTSCVLFEEPTVLQPDCAVGRCLAPP
jgi:hypothetical protein